MHPVEFDVEANDGAARAGTATTARGSYTTPLFMPVGTRGAIKYLSATDYASVGAQIVLGNTYHLMLRPGAELVERFGGLGRFAGWDGLTLTDSGGFQVFSLDPKVDDDGVTFKSTYDGSSHRFTPEIAVDVQQRLGAFVKALSDMDRVRAVNGIQPGFDEIRHERLTEFFSGCRNHVLLVNPQELFWIK